MSSRTWGSKSQQVRATLDPRLQRVVDRILAEVCDIALIYGFRSEQEQNYLHAQKRSQLRWPQSKHNKQPSLAVDFTTFPVNLKATKLREELAFVAGAAIAIAREEGVKLRWGGDWNRNGDLDDNGFDDYFHLEIDDD